MIKGKEYIEPGYIYVPYIIVNVATSINGEVVWYRNKWKNFWLKVKFLFVKPKYLKHVKKYSEKTINPKYYGKITIKENE